MFVGSKWVRKMATQTLVALLLLQVLIGCTEAATKCHKCTGINCQRTSYTATEDCVDALDSCTTIFQGSTVLAQGCLGQLAVELRNKCETPTNTNEDNEVAMEGEKLQTANAACYRCREDLCNEVSGEAFECIQCDSNADGECASGNLQPAKCPIGRSMNSYCYTKVEGKRAIRGCATNLVEQKECLNSNDCVLCSPLDISGCNRDPKISTDGTGSGSESGGSDNGTGTGDGGSSSGGGGGNGGGSGTGDGGSSSGGGGGNGGGSGTGDGGSNSGGGGGNNSGSNNGTGSGTGDGGSSSGNGGSGTESGGSDNGSSSGNDTTDSGNNNTSGATLISNYKLLTTVIFILLALFKF
ncbi:protein rtoA-like [Anastrepha ludens]|uniref:protein rtoA-like n=1 Tax=Anastrepha ludens TaxID=28586 RepID=UPI0023AEA022|nr:protein rtoA-like [Anastrepha ludens]